MPSSKNQKMKLLYLLKILLEKTDENHTLTLQQLLNELVLYGIQAERKSLYTDFESLRFFGLDVLMRQTKSYGYFVASRDFELAELKLLVDAVQSSRFISTKKTNQLIDKISSLTSIHQAKQLNRQVFVVDKPKTMNEQVLYNIDHIHDAINKNRKINFHYFYYDLDKVRHLNKSGELYVQTPLALCWSEDNYYLICYHTKTGNYTQYRVDRMIGVDVSEENADIINRKSYTVTEHIKQMVGMYGGDVVNVKLRFDNSLTNTVFDRFGIGIFVTKKQDSFEIITDISVSPVFFGWMAQFGNKAEIIEPKSLRDGMKQLVSELTQQYERS